MLTKKRYARGIILSPDDVGVQSIEGELKVSLTQKLFQVYLDGALRNIVTNNQAQTLTNKTVVVANNIITTAASGNLAATELNAALAELQTDVDTRATQANFTAHTGANTAHGTTSAIVGVDDTQILKNKTINANQNTIITQPTLNLEATNLNDALYELQSDIDTRATKNEFNTHVSSTTAHPASKITNAPYSNMTEPDVQNAINVLVDRVNDRATNSSVNTHINNALGAHAATAISTNPITGVTGVNVQEVASNLKTQIDSHASKITGAHAASAISNVPSGNLAATDLQGAVNELQSDIDTRATSTQLTTHSSSTTGVHGVTGSVVGTQNTQTLTNKTIIASQNSIVTNSVTNLAATELNEALAELQADIDTRVTNSALTTALDAKVTGPASATANALARYDSTTGKLVKNSVGVLSDAGALTGLTNVSAGNLRLGTNTITTATGPLSLSSADGKASTLAAFNFAGSLARPAVEQIFSGINQEIAIGNFSKLVIKGTATSFVGITGFENGGSYGLDVTITNRTGTTITFKNESTAASTTTARIRTGTGADLELANDASIQINYDDLFGRWFVVGGVGSSNAGAGTVATSTGETAVIDLTNNITSPINTGIVFTYPTISSFEIFAQIVRTTSSAEASEVTKILGIYRTSTSSWEITDTGVGASGVVFTMTPAGALQYTSSNLSGTSYVGKMTYSYQANGGAIIGTAVPVASTGGINYNTNPTLESNTTGYTAFADDSASPVPVDGTGGAPTVTVTSTTTALRGTKSLLFTKTGANSQGQGFSSDFTIDSADKTKIVKVAFDYSSSTGYLDSDMRVYVLDKTNNKIIELVHRDLMASAQGSYVSYFQASPDSVEYRLIFIVANVNTNSFTVSFDNFSVGPYSQVRGSITTDWQSFTPVVNSMTSVSSIGGKWRRVGDSMEITGYMLFSGTGASSTFFLGIPDGRKIETSKLPGTASMYNNFGTWGWYNDSGPLSSQGGFVTYNIGDSGIVNFIRSDNSNNLITDVFAASDRLNFNFKVPIAGWSSNMVMSEDAGNREIVGKFQKSGSQALTNSAVTLITGWSVIKDSASGLNVSKYDIKESGDHDLVFNAELSVDILNVLAYRVTTGGVVGAWIYCSAFTSNFRNTGTAFIPNLKRGDSVEVGVYVISSPAVSIAGSANTTMSVIKRSSPQTIGMGERVGARAVKSTSQNIPNSTATVLTWDANKTYDFTNSLNPATGYFTAPIAGIYEVDAGILFVAGGWPSLSVIELTIHKNLETSAYQTLDRPIISGNTNFGAWGTGKIFLNQGETACVKVSHTFGSATNTFASQQYNFFSITKVG